MVIVASVHFDKAAGKVAITFKYTFSLPAAGSHASLANRVCAANNTIR